MGELRGGRTEGEGRWLRRHLLLLKPAWILPPACLHALLDILSWVVHYYMPLAFPLTNDARCGWLEA